MRRWSASGLCALLLSAAGLVLPLGPARADDAPPPYIMMRRLQEQQELLTRGSGAAQAAQAELMAAIPSTFLAADSGVWREPRNARAAVMYLLSGGRPSVIRTILTRSTMPRDIEPLLRGALAYAEGQDQIARDLLQPVDPRGLPSTLGGHLALVEATLFARTDKAKARKLLELARLLVPGTLIEEAALRRQALLDDDPSALGAYVFVARQYIHRFQTSIYAQNFKQQLGAITIKFGTAGDLTHLGMLDAVIAELPVEEQRALYLAVAKIATVQGRTDVVRFAAGHAAAIAKASTGDSARAQLYMAAAMIVSPEVAKGVERLEATDRSRLSPADADLRDAALAVARSVTYPVPEAADAKADPAPEDASHDALVEQARQAIARGDKLLEESAP